MNKAWIDVSVTLHRGMVHWPGDPAISIRRVSDMNHGDPANVSKLSIGSHTGTHMDAPFHFLRMGKPLDKMPLSAVIGEARVIAIRDSQAVTLEELHSHRIRRGERILFKTRNSTRCWETDTFVKDFVYLSEEAAQDLAQVGVQTVGVDYLSVGGYTQDGARVHRILLKAGVWIIEGLNLSKVGPGTYEFVCLPLKILDSDGAPARAVLRPIERSGKKKG